MSRHKRTTKHDLSAEAKLVFEYMGVESVERRPSLKTKTKARETHLVMPQDSDDSVRVLDNQHKTPINLLNGSEIPTNLQDTTKNHNNSATTPAIPLSKSLQNFKSTNESAFDCVPKIFDKQQMSDVSADCLLKSFVHVGSNHALQSKVGLSNRKIAQDSKHSWQGRKARVVKEKRSTTTSKAFRSVSKDPKVTKVHLDFRSRTPLATPLILEGKLPNVNYGQIPQNRKVYPIISFKTSDVPMHKQNISLPSNQMSSKQSDSDSTKDKWSRKNAYQESLGRFVKVDLEEHERQMMKDSNDFKISTPFYNTRLGGANDWVRPWDREDYDCDENLLRTLPINLNHNTNNYTRTDNQSTQKAYKQNTPRLLQNDKNQVISHSRHLNWSHLRLLDKADEVSVEVFSQSIQKCNDWLSDAKYFRVTEPKARSDRKIVVSK